MEDKMKAVSKYPIPGNGKADSGLPRTHPGYFRKFIERYASIAAPSFKPTSKRQQKEIRESIRRIKIEINKPTTASVI